VRQTGFVSSGLAASAGVWLNAEESEIIATLWAKWLGKQLYFLLYFDTFSTLLEVFFNISTITLMYYMTISLLVCAICYQEKHLAADQPHKGKSVGV